MLLGEVTDIDLAAPHRHLEAGGITTATPYDSLIVAAGATTVLLRQRRLRAVRARA